MSGIVPPPQEASSSIWAHGVPEPAGSGTRPGWLLLGTVLFNGPVVWAVHLVAGIALVPAACAHGVGWAINVLTVVTALIIAAILAEAVRLLLRHRPEGPDPDQVVALIAFLGVLWGSISLLVTLLEGVPNLVLNACPI